MITQVGNIAVFGKHEDKVIEQMQRCLNVPEAVSGVILGDAHYGYSQPVGGVAAYRNAISPSGVGYDIACFTGDQTVELADGRSLTFLELVEEDRQGKINFVFSIDPTGNVVLDRLEAPRQTGMTQTLARTTLDNGQVIQSTADHVFYRRDGSECLARDLSPGDSLMPLYLARYGDVPMEKRLFKGKRSKIEEYMGVYCPEQDKYALVHHLADDYNLHHGLDAADGGPIRHHVDFNKYNNNPDNIKRLGWVEHFRIHSAAASVRATKKEIGFGRAHKLHPDFFSKMGHDNMTKLHQRPDFQARLKVRASENMQIMLASDACRKNWDKAGERGAVGITAYNKSDAGRAQARVNGKGPRLCSVCQENFDNLSHFMKHWHAVHRTPEQKATQAASLVGRNHKVVSSETITLPSPVPVYCLTAPNHHNFALAAGVFVHNCGLKAVRTSLKGSAVRANMGEIMDRIFAEVQFGIGKTTGETSDHALFDDRTWTDVPGLINLKRMAAQQLGTVGSGNHFCDLLTDENDDVWIMAHFGSRGFGHKTATGFLNLAHGRAFDARGGNDSMDAAPTLIRLDSALGQDYHHAMQLCGRYAYAGRDAVVNQVLDILGVGNPLEVVHNHHNFAWIETHNGEDVVVVRKGATPNAPGQVSAIGGSMGDISVIIEGVDSDLSRIALQSTVHGAGRVMSRTRAAGKLNYKTGQRAGGEITHQAMHEWLNQKGVVLRGAGTDEAPQAYKRLPSVLREHEGTFKILHTLTPIGVAMAGGNDRASDPYAD